MRPAAHFVASAVSGTVLGALTQSVSAGLACFLSGIFIDLDHCLDYFLCRGMTLDYHKFSRAMYHLELPRFTLLLHSYELLALFWVILVAQQLPLVWWGAAVGLTLHIVSDQVFNGHNIRFYFLSFRAFHGFKTEAMKRYGQRKHVFNCRS